MFAKKNRYALYYIVAVGQHVSPRIFAEHVFAKFRMRDYRMTTHKPYERFRFLNRQQFRHDQYIFGRYFLRQYLEIPFHFRLFHFTPPNLILPFSGKRRRCIGRWKESIFSVNMRKSTGKAKIVAYVYKKSVPNEKSRVRKQTLLGSKFESGEMNRYSLAKSVNIYRKIFYILRYCKGLMPYLFLNK